jgi:hypothetical protein
LSIQLGVAGKQLAVKQGDPFSQIQRANEIAKEAISNAVHHAKSALVSVALRW